MFSIFTGMRILLFVLMILFNQHVYSQSTNQPENTLKTADANLNYGNFRKALEYYVPANKQDSGHQELNYKIGFCYVNMNDDKSKAIPYLEIVVKQAKVPDEAWFYLGKAYHWALRFDEAIAAYEKYKERVDAKSIRIAERQIQMCKNGKVLVSHPLHVTFENLGKEINSSYPDYNPIVPDDESFMIYTSRRKGNVGNFIDDDAFYTADI